MKSFFRQVFAMIRDNKLFSAIYIVGTAVAIAFTMVMVIANYVKIAPVYPETNRMRTMYLNTAVYVDSIHSSTMGSSFSPEALNEWGYHLKNAEIVSGNVRNMGMIRTEGDIHDYLVNMIFTDVNFFKVYPFRFKEGRPFTQEEFDGGVRVAVISDEQARKVYGSDKGVVGRTLFVNADTMRIVGIVESASPFTYHSYAQVYTPYSLWRFWPQPGRLYQGHLAITMVLPDANGEQALREEIEDVVRRHNLQNGEWQLKLNGQPVSHVQDALFKKDYFNDDGETNPIVDFIKKYMLILVVLLVVPALNLSGMIARRMEIRMAEMGVRKAFGATRGRLLRQIINENLLLTLLGGVLGLLLSWVVFYVFHTWIFALVDDNFCRNSNMGFLDAGQLNMLSWGMFFSPFLFICVLLFCIVLNLLSALVPAWLSLRKPIVNSMNVKR